MATDKPVLFDFDSEDFPDVGHDREVFSGANDFNFPQTEIPRDPGQHDGTERMMNAVFSQPRRRG